VYVCVSVMYMVGATLGVCGCVGDGGGGTRGIVVWAIRHRPDRRGSRRPTMGYTTPDRTIPQRHPTFLTPTREFSVTATTSTDQYWRVQSTTPL